jgi:hypothetical protein
MKPSAQLSWRMAATALLVLVALWFAWNRYGAITFYDAQLKNRLRDLRELRVLAAAEAGQRAGVEQLLSGAGAEENLSVLVREYLPGIKVDIKPRETTPAMDGWSMKRYDVRIDRVAAGPLAEFLAACENARPPVRIVDIEAALSRAGANSELAVQLCVVELMR